MKEYLKKYKLYIIIGVSILILSVGGTLAYYIWSSNTNAIVNTEVCTPTVTFAGGSTINGVDIVPVLTKEEGTIKDIEVKKNSTCNRDVTMNLYLELTTFPTELAESSFVYELYKNSETMAIASGNFANKEQGNTITLLSNQILNTSKDTYTLYIYIDGNVDNPSTMAGKNFLFKLWGSGEGAIYKENVITTSDNPTGGTSKFFNTEVMREEIQSLTIAEDNTVPDIPGVVSKDISQNKDGTVMLWYTPKEVASSDGSTKTMYDMFFGCHALQKLNVSNFNTPNVINMGHMFQECSSLIDLDISNFNTSKVTNMSTMFMNCSSLTALDLSNFNTSKVTNMNFMFNGCSNLTSLDLSNFNTNNVTDMSFMFYGCSSLTSLDLSNFNTSKVTLTNDMFYDCSSLVNLNLSSFNTSNVTNMNGMFYDCSSLVNLNLSSFNTSNVTNMYSMFAFCKNIKTIYVSDLWNTSNVTSSSLMFHSCTSLSGAVSYDNTKTDISMANYTTGYLTYKSNN